MVGTFPHFLALLTQDLPAKLSEQRLSGVEPSSGQLLFPVDFRACKQQLEECRM